MRYMKLTHTAINVTTATAAALAANADRVYLLLVNDSDTPVYIKFGADAVANQGIRLNAHGGSLELRGDFMDVRAVNAIHGSTGNKVLLVSQGV